MFLRTNSFPSRTFFNATPCVFSFVRWCSASDEQNLPELSRLLRKFYLKVHPDLFANHPHQRSVNQASLKELTTFVGEWKKRLEPLPYSPVSSKIISFYVKETSKSKSQPDESKTQLDASKTTAEEDQETFKEISMKLINNGTFNSVKNEFVHLFKETGLPDEFLVGNKTSITETYDDLQEFVMKNKFGAKENYLKETQAEKQVNDLIFSLRTKYKITLDKGFPFEHYYALENLQVISKLNQVLEILSESNPEIVQGLKDVTISVDSPTGRYAVDYETAHIYLEREESVESFVTAFENLNLIKLKQGIQDKSKLKPNELEKALERVLPKANKLSMLLGIDSIAIAPKESFYSEDLKILDDGDISSVVYHPDEEVKAYVNLLKQLEHANLQRIWKKHALRGLNVRIRTLHPGETSCLDSDGNLLISHTVEPTEFISIINQHGPSAVARMREQEALQNSIRFIVARLGLSNFQTSGLFLRFVEGAYQKQVIAIKKIEAAAGELRKYDFSGLSLGIDNEYRVGEDGTLWIRWDFEIEILKRLVSKIRDKEQNKE